MFNLTPWRRDYPERGEFTRVVPQAPEVPTERNLSKVEGLRSFRRETVNGDSSQLAKW